MTAASFDTLGRIRSESFGNDGSGNTLWLVTSGYNTTGQRTHLTYPAHGTWPTKRPEYTWDDYGRSSAALFEEKMYLDKNDRVTRIDWPKGRLNSTETEAQIHTYDQLSRLTKGASSSGAVIEARERP